MAGEFDSAGFEKLVYKLQVMGAGMETLAEEYVSKVSGHIQRRATENAPILTGNLRSNILVLTPEIKNGVVTGGVVDDVPYAFEMHENLQPYGAGPYNLGRVSLQQPNTIEGGVGGKYLERVVQFHAQSYLSALEQATKKLISGNNPQVEVDTT